MLYLHEEDCKNADGIDRLVDFDQPVQIGKLVYFKDKSGFEVPQYVALLDCEKPPPPGSHRNWGWIWEPEQYAAFVLAHSKGAVKKHCTVQSLLDRIIVVHKCKRRIWRYLMDTKLYTPILVTSVKGKKGVQLIEDPSINVENKFSYYFRPHGLMVDNEPGNGS